MAASNGSSADGESNSGQAGRLFLVETKDQTMRITVPHGFKMTFGPLLPFETKSAAARNRGGYNDGSTALATTALRVYRGKDEPVMVLPHVVSFREIGPLKVELMEVDTHGKETWREDTKGEIERSQKRRQQVAIAMVEGEKSDLPF